MDPNQYFTPGSKGFILTKQALETINAAEKSGLSEEAKQLRSDLESSIQAAQQSGWKNLSGFGTQLEVVNTLAPKIAAIRQGEAKQQEDYFKKEEKFKELSSQIDTAKNLLGSAGKTLDPKRIQAIESAKQSGDMGVLKENYDVLKKEADDFYAVVNKPKTEKEIKAEQLESESKDILVEGLKEKYRNIVEVKNNPEIRQAFGVPVGLTSTGLVGGMVTSRLIPGSGAAVARVGVDQLADQEWIDTIIKSKAAGATFGALSDKEGGRLSSAASKLSKASMLDYNTGNKELQRMAESVKKLYTKATGRNIADDVGIETVDTDKPKEIDPALKARQAIEGFPSAPPN